MTINPHLKELIGQKITGVVAMEGPRSRKIHLVLDNNSYFEFTGSDLHNAKGSRSGGKEKACGTEQGYYEIVEEFWEG